MDSLLEEIIPQASAISLVPGIQKFFRQEWFLLKFHKVQARYTLYYVRLGPCPHSGAPGMLYSLGLHSCLRVMMCDSMPGKILSNWR